MFQRLPHWRLSVDLREGLMATTATIDFERRYTLEVQLAQLATPQTKDTTRLFEFSNEFGDLLAVRANTYQTHRISHLP